MHMVLRTRIRWSVLVPIHSMMIIYCVVSAEQVVHAVNDAGCSPWFQVSDNSALVIKTLNAFATVIIISRVLQSVWIPAV